MGVTKGKKLMVWVQRAEGEPYESIAYATSHTFQSSLSTVETSTKDDVDGEGLGRWGSSEADQFTWSVSTENLVAYSGIKGHGMDALWSIYETGEPVKIRFGLAKNSTTGPDAENGWELNTEMMCLEGMAIITSLTINAANGDNATFSAEFTGVGKCEVG